MLVLAFDIERSGATSAYDTIALGASVLFYNNTNNLNFQELDRFSYGCYSEKWTNFEKRCYDEFWSKNLDILKEIEYKGGLQSKNECEYEMINLFQEFRKKWELFATQNKYDYILVSDNKVYDGGFVNELICKYLVGVLPLPFTALTQKYDCFVETHSIEVGLLLSHGINLNWGTSKKIAKLYDVPICPIVHNHNPANDAMTIAWEYLVLICISKGYIKLREGFIN